MEGGLDYARNLLSKALGTQRRARDIGESHRNNSASMDLSQLQKQADAHQIMNVISNEHPQTIALILCYFTTG